MYSQSRHGGRNMNQYLIVTDTPGIKQFVFGADPLIEIRGASALLDQVNRNETPERLKQALVDRGGRLTRTVFCNGGTGQFLVEAVNAEDVEAAAGELAAYCRGRSGGELRIACGVAPYHPDTYSTAVGLAHRRMRLSRELEQGRKAVSLVPVLMQCDSLSYLPVEASDSWGGEFTWISQATRVKREEGKQNRSVWGQWLECLATEHGHLWPERKAWHKLRPRDFTKVGENASGRAKGTIGLVYADGNAMGRLVQKLNHPDVCESFSKTVDGSIRTACFLGLGEVCAAEIEANCKRGPDDPLRVLPADILLLGGDDLLVILPGDRAVAFAERICGHFERLTREKLDAIDAGPAQDFFQECGLGGDRGMTISCGVALAHDSYPFYLLLDLAEELLRSAKAAGSKDPRKQDYWAPSYVDFHRVVTSSSHQVSQVRREVYYTESERPRTLRPVPVEQVERLRQGVDVLRESGLPRNKLHGLLNGSLSENPRKAEWRILPHGDSLRLLFLHQLFHRIRRTKLGNSKNSLLPSRQYPSSRRWASFPVPSIRCLLMSTVGVSGVIAEGGNEHSAI